MSSFGAQIAVGRVTGDSISVCQRDNVISKHDADIGSRELAEEFRCSKRTINNDITVSINQFESISTKIWSAT